MTTTTAAARTYIQQELAGQPLADIQEQLRVLRAINIHTLPTSEWDTYRIAIDEFQKAADAR